MTNKNHQLVAQLRRIIRELADLVESIEPEETTLAPAVAAHVAACIEKRICLGCGLPITENEIVDRGNHKKCAGTLRRRIREGKTTIEAEVLAGRILLEKKQPGKKAAIDMRNAEMLKNSVQKAAEKGAKYHERKPKP
jgi:hypothetical protein